MSKTEKKKKLKILNCRLEKENDIAQSAGAVEYTDCFSEEG